MTSNTSNPLSNIICGNCGKKGHKYKECNNPITSYGIICLNYLDEDLNQYVSTSQNRYSNNIRNTGEYHKLVEKLGNNLKILMICRKDTIGYIELIRGNYKIDDQTYLKTLCSYMTEKEKKRLLDNINNFDFIWIKLWSLDNHNVDRRKIENEYPKAKNKFERLKETYNLEELLNDSEYQWTQAEWGFPKGRRNIREKDITCACREFEEETGFSKDEYEILNIKPIYENFIGCNGQAYRHVYLVAQSKKVDTNLSAQNIHQATEISDIRWVTFHEGMELIRDYHRERKKSLRYLFNLIKNMIFNSECETISNSE